VAAQRSRASVAPSSVSVRSSPAAGSSRPRAQLAGERLERRVVEPGDRLHRGPVRPAAGTVLAVEDVHERVGVGDRRARRGLARAVATPAGRCGGDERLAVVLGALDESLASHAVEHAADARPARAERARELLFGERGAALGLGGGERGEHRVGGAQVGVLAVAGCRPAGHATVELREHPAGGRRLVGIDRLAGQRGGQRRVQGTRGRLVQLDPDLPWRGHGITAYPERSRSCAPAASCRQSGHRHRSKCSRSTASCSGRIAIVRHQHLASCAPQPNSRPQDSQISGITLERTITARLDGASRTCVVSNRTSFGHALYASRRSQ
jgi:hypothetical protein